MEKTVLKGEWKCAQATHGGQFAMWVGMRMTLVQPAAVQGFIGVSTPALSKALH